MVWPIGIGAVVILALALAGSTRRREPSQGSEADLAEELDGPFEGEPDASALALDDPLEALTRYGTADDAARLAEQGVDLSGLGYRPPEAR